VQVGNSPERGPKNAPVTIVEFSDFQCPFCGRVEPTIKQIEDTYKGKVRLVWKNQPLSFHPNAMPAAEAAMAAYAQGNEKFWEMHDKLFANQTALSPAMYEQTAKDIGLDMSKWKSDVESHKYSSQIQADMSAGSAVGASGTPTFFITGKRVVGALPFDSFKQVIDAELASKVAKK
jgi:protein-disulfide isomerase